MQPCGCNLSAARAFSYVVGRQLLECGHGFSPRLFGIGSTMKAHSCPHSPLAPLLRTYCEAGILTTLQLADLPVLGARFRSVSAARGTWLNESFLESAEETAFQKAVCCFYEGCVLPPLHVQVPRQRAGIVRHGLQHLLLGVESRTRKFVRCLAADGPYHVAGLGPSFWSAILQALDVRRNPSWTPTTIAGLRRLGLVRAECRTTNYAEVAAAHEQLFALAPVLTSLHLEHFLALVAAMRGRDLRLGQMPAEPEKLLAVAMQQERARLPLRVRLKENGRQLECAKCELKTALANQEGSRFRAALREVDQAGAERAPIDWIECGEALAIWIGRLWECVDPYEMLERFWQADPIPGAGLWLPAAVLHLRDPEQFALWDDKSRRAYAEFDDSLDFCGDTATRYRLFNEGLAWLRQRHHWHPLETRTVLENLDIQSPRNVRFNGFCLDTFRFLEELASNNRRSWMECQRARYRFAVREPLIELCRALVERYVEPVLHQGHGWEFDTMPRSGHALTSICKNDYGRTRPYNTALWITFCRNGLSAKRTDAQLFVRIDATGASYGLRIGPEAREASQRLRRHIQQDAAGIVQALREHDALTRCRFGESSPGASDSVVSAPDDLRAWASARELIVRKHVEAGSPLLSSEEFVGDVLLTFDSLLPLFACATLDDPAKFLVKPAATSMNYSTGVDEFLRATYLDATWLQRAQELLRLKRQLILQGVPGTGKTHVARSLATLLTGGRDDAVRLVQFHPAFGYEEFVEGIKVKSIEVNGRSDVSYPVEDGLLCAFASEAARHPSLPHVLLIDELNRGNLPRIFGELLYVLEYRDQAVVLPYSRRPFQLPANLYILGTMNAADRSVALVDQALRRRFSFLEMLPDARVLGRWLKEHPPEDATAEAIVTLFERLNRHLGRDLGPQHFIGHSFFMVPELDEARLRIVWEHQVMPQVEELLAAHPERLANYKMERLWRRERETAELLNS
jgi:uncharacterized protein (DUF2461 family)